MENPITWTMLTRINNRLFRLGSDFKRQFFAGSLERRDFPGKFTLDWIWQVNNQHEKAKVSPVRKIRVFGADINLSQVHWHRDYISGFEYPIRRFDKIRIAKWYNKGIDVKFPWEMSRFYFAVAIAQNYYISRDIQYYDQFKSIFTDWMERNPFLCGVNWWCTMEVAIRAVNWIVAGNLLRSAIEKDREFYLVFVRSLIQCAEYISTFAEFYPGGHSNNHTVADYCGLLFLALTLKDHPKSLPWLKQSREGLIKCIAYQVNDDGADFEYSIPYHRLVLELLGYSTLVCRVKQVRLSEGFYNKLFKMFEYAAAYMDDNGNAPQVGDNDSGRLLIFHELEEHDHSYLLDLGEHIFDHKFNSQCKKSNARYKAWLPKSENEASFKPDVIPRRANGSIFFRETGAYILKNNHYSLYICCFRSVTRSRGGHRHVDTGSFTFSHKGKPIVVDPGTFCYTRDFSERNRYRSYCNHNVIISDEEDMLKLPLQSFWVNFKDWFSVEVLESKDSSIEVFIENRFTKIGFRRKWQLEGKCFAGIDLCEGNFKSFLHLHPQVRVERSNDKEVVTNFGGFYVGEGGAIKIDKYAYSPEYGVKIEAVKLVFRSNNRLSYQFRSAMD